MALQSDVVSIPARRLAALLNSLHSDDADAEAALRLLKNWDANLESSSSQAALEEVWLSRHLGSSFCQAVLSKAAIETSERAATSGRPRPTDRGNGVDPRTMLDALEHPETHFRGNPTEQRDRLLLSSLEAAYREMKGLQGQDPTQWQWGKLQFNLCEHPLSPVLDEQTRATVNVGPIPKHGGRYTVNASLYQTSDYRQIGGPSARLIIDLGNWDNSQAVNHPGESGDPDSPHYRDLAPLWRTGQYFPLLYSRQAVENAAEKKYELLPLAAPR